MIISVLVVFVIILNISTQNKQKTFEEEKNQELLQTYNAAQDIIMAKLESTDERDIAEISSLSRITGAISNLLEIRNDDKKGKTSKNEYELYKRISTYQNTFGTELIPEDELKDKIIVFKKLAYFDLSEIQNETGLQGWYFLKNLLDFWESSWGLSILIILLFTTWSQELEKEHIRMIKALPVSLKRYYNVKFLTVASFVVGVLFLFIFLVFWICGLLNGLGSLNYPILTSAHETIPLGHFLLISIAFNIPAILLVLTIIEALSFVSRSSTLTFFFSCLFILLGNILSQQICSPFNYYFFAFFEGAKVIKNYYPFSYSFVLIAISIMVGLSTIIRKISFLRIEEK